jgi:hypothetical protein
MIRSSTPPPPRTTFRSAERRYINSLRVLVRLGGVPVSGVKQIQLQSAFGPEQPNGNLFVKRTIKHAQLQTVTGSVAPCPSFQFHAEFGGESNPIQLKDGTYRLKVLLKVGNKTKTSNVRALRIIRPFSA